MKVGVEEFASLLGPDGSDVDFRRIFGGRKIRKKSCAIFETFSSDRPGEFLVVSSTQWDKQQRRLNAPWRQNSSTSSSGREWQAGLEEQRFAWSSSEGKVMGAVEDYLENVPIRKWTFEASERLMEPEDEKVSFRYVLKYSTRGGSNIFQLFDTAEKKDHFVASRRRWLEGQGKKAALQESWQNEWHDVRFQGVLAKAPPCPERTLKTPLPHQNSSSSRDEGSRWVVEDRRRRRVAFEETAKGTLRYSEDLKVSVTELQEQLEISEEAGVSIKQVAQQARIQQKFEFFRQRRRGVHWQLGQMERAVNRSGGVGKKGCQHMRQEVNLLE